METAIILTLELLNLIILFKGVLGYGFRENKLWLIGGIGLFFVEWGLETGVVNMGVLFLGIQFCIPAMGALLLFQGRKIIVFFISMAAICVIKMLDTWIYGICILIYKGDIARINFSITFIVAAIVSLAIYETIIMTFKKKRTEIHRYTEKLNPSIVLVFVLYSWITEFMPWGVGEFTQLEQEIMHGQNIIRGGVISILVTGVFVLLCILSSQAKAMRQILYLTEKCIQEQTEQYRLLSKQDIDLRRFRHDYKAHITALQELAMNNETEKIIRYINTFPEIKSQKKFIYTNHVIGDGILNQYAGLCKEENIEFSVKGELPDNLVMTETEFCILISNGVRNAFEAAKKCDKGEKSIFVELKTIGVYIRIDIFNSVAEALILKDGIPVTTKKDTLNHGIGKRNMLEAVRAYGGNIHWSYDGETKMVNTKIIFRNYD